MKGVRVKVVNRNRKYLVMRWLCPKEGVIKEKSTGTKSRREANRKALEFEQSLNCSPIDPEEYGWADFRLQYELEHLNSQSKDYRGTWSSAANALELHCSPSLVADVTTPMLSKLANALKSTCADATIETYIRHLQAGLSWAVEMEVLQSSPKTPRLGKRRKKAEKKMKGRPLTDDEFKRILKAVPSVLDEKRVSDWIFFLRGLWLSGLRIQEAVTLSWEQRAGSFSIESIDSPRPMLRLCSERDKGGRDGLSPLTPDFVSLLREVPRDARYGFVFNPSGHRVSRMQTANAVGRVVSDICTHAKIEVGKKRGEYATAHDLRRSFASRWSSKVMPADLRELMRHKSIQTTMLFYVGQDAKRTADAVWDAFHETKGDFSGDTKEKPDPDDMS